MGWECFAAGRGVCKPIFRMDLWNGSAAGGLRMGWCSKNGAILTPVSGGKGYRLPDLHGRFRRDECRVRKVVRAQAGEELCGRQGATEGGAGRDGVCCAALMSEIWKA